MQNKKSNMSRECLYQVAPLIAGTGSSLLAIVILVAVIASIILKVKNKPIKRLWIVSSIILFAIFATTLIIFYKVIYINVRTMPIWQ